MQENLERNVYWWLVATVGVVLALGTVVYHVLEKFSWVDSYYFSVITLTTVGYGDMTPHTTAGKLFTTGYVLVGIGIITTFISVSMQRRGKKFRKRWGKKSDS